MFSKKFYAKVFVLSASLVLAAPSLAAETNKNTESTVTKPLAETQTTASESVLEQKKINKAKTKIATSETFKPTESISEDLSVSFPVDI